MDVRVTLPRPAGAADKQGWWRLVTGVDPTKNDGYALLGRFIDPGPQRIPTGSVLVRKEYRQAPRRLIGKGSVHVVDPNGTITQVFATDDWKDGFSQLLHVVSDRLRQQPVRTDDRSHDRARATRDSTTNQFESNQVLLVGFTDVELIAELRRRGHKL